MDLSISIAYEDASDREISFDVNEHEEDKLGLTLSIKSENEYKSYHMNYVYLNALLDCVSESTDARKCRLYDRLDKMCSIDSRGSSILFLSARLAYEAARASYRVVRALYKVYRTSESS
jgi:hypothetical protein